MKSPCLDCEFKDKNKLFHSACDACERRLEYVAALGDMTHSVPIGMTDLVQTDGCRLPGGIKKGDVFMERQKTKTCKGDVCRTINPDGVARPVAEFGPKGNTPDKLQYACRMCLAFSVHKAKLKKQGLTADPAAYAATYKPYWRGGAPVPPPPKKPAAAVPEEKESRPNVSVPPPPAGRVGNRNRTVAKDAGAEIIIDFSRVPGALAAIETAAADELRTPENQLLFIIKRWMDGRGRPKAEGI